MEPNGQSLQSQMAKLQRSIRNRDKRRYDERERRAAEAAERGDGDPYDSKVARRRTTVATGGVQLGSSTAQAALDPPRTWRCELCKVTFSSEVSLQQHVSGPVHAKALAAQQAQREKNERLSRTRGLAEAALAAAQWQAGDAGGSVRGGQASTSAAVTSGNTAAAANGSAARLATTAHAAQGPPPRWPLPLSHAQPSSSQAQQSLSHADMVAEAQRSLRQNDIPNIDGWAPPAVQLPPLNPPAPRNRPEAAGDLPGPSRALDSGSEDEGAGSAGDEGDQQEEEVQPEEEEEEGPRALFPLVDYADDSQSEEESGSESEHSNNSNLNAGPVEVDQDPAAYDGAAVFNNGMQQQNFNEGQSESESQESEDNDSSDSDAVGLAVESFF